MRSETLRSSKLIIAAMRSRSLELKIDLGVRCITPINSSRVLGEYLGAGGFLARYFSNLGSRNFTIFCISLPNMIL